MLVNILLPSDLKREMEGQDQILPGVCLPSWSVLRFWQKFKDGTRAKDKKKGRETAEQAWITGRDTH